MCSVHLVNRKITFESSNNSIVFRNLVKNHGNTLIMVILIIVYQFRNYKHRKYHKHRKLIDNINKNNNYNGIQIEEKFPENMGNIFYNKCGNNMVNGNGLEFENTEMKIEIKINENVKIK